MIGCGSWLNSRVSEFGPDASANRFRVGPECLSEPVDLLPLLQGRHAVLGLRFARGLVLQLRLLHLLEIPDGVVEPDCFRVQASMRVRTSSLATTSAKAFSRQDSSSERGGGGSIG